MCGIAGIVDFDNSNSINESTLELMSQTILHRGPDMNGLWRDSVCGLAHTRLSILDLSEDGKQPMLSSDSRIIVVFNGEIYNFRELKKELNEYSFRTRSDTEVIIAAYQKWGLDFVQKLNGMFSIALYDKSLKKVFLFRDRLGIKPLFYSVKDKCLVFSSEIKSILKHPKFTQRDMNTNALNEYLGLNYCVAPNTLFKDIYQVMPGQFLEFDESSQINKFFYWDLKEKTKSFSGNEKQAKDRLEEQLMSSLKLRSISDVEVGVFLSGGVDSSTISYYFNKLNPDQKIKTFSIGFEEMSYNELPYAKKVAEDIGSEHYSKVVKADAVQVLEKIVWHSEEPTADSSMIPMYHLSQLAREHVKVVLSGDGADELMAGYETHTAYFLAKYYKSLPSLLQASMVAGINKLPVSSKKISLEQKMKRFVYAAQKEPWHSHYLWRVIWTDEQKNLLYTPKMKELSRESQPEQLYKNHFENLSQTELNKILYLDIKEYLPNDMLVKVDRMSMAHGLEARVPFLDHELVEFAWSLPDSMKLKKIFNKKYLLKEMIKPHLPKEVWGRKKAGFNVPVAKWLRADLLSTLKEEVLEGEMLKEGLFSREYLEKTISSHSSGEQDFSHQLWGMLTLSIWYRLFLGSSSRG